jgi:uncharacterized Zn finger protein (UPF0148 family)
MSDQKPNARVEIYTGKCDGKDLEKRLAAWWSIVTIRDPKAAKLTLRMDKPPETTLDAVTARIRLVSLEKTIQDNELVAVPFDDEVVIPPPGAERTAADSKRADAKAESLQVKYLGVLKGAKSLNVGCKTCDSRIARKYLKDVRCPVCGGSLLSDSYRKTLEAAELAAQEYRESITFDRAQPRKTRKGTFLLVAGLVPAAAPPTPPSTEPANEAEPDDDSDDTAEPAHAGGGPEGDQDE